MLFAILGALIFVGMFSILAGWLISIVNKRLPIIYQFKHPFLMAFVGMGLGYVSVITLILYSERLHLRLELYILALLILILLVYGYCFIKEINLIPLRKLLLGIVLTLLSPALYILLIFLLIFAVN